MSFEASDTHESEHLESLDSSLKGCSVTGSYAGERLKLLLLVCSPDVIFSLASRRSVNLIFRAGSRCYGVRKSMSMRDQIVFWGQDLMLQD